MKTITAFLLLAALLALASAATKWHQLHEYTFEDYEREFDKHYAHKAERLLRKKVFEHKLAAIRAHNKDATKSWKQGVNHLSDRTDEELKSLTGSFPSHKTKLNPKALLKNIDLAKLEDQNVDWRAKGVTTAVKDQGRCGSCWAFAAATVLESSYALLTGQLSALSEQQILDCTPNPNECGGKGGCEGGTVELAFERIQQLGGLSTEWTYPYVSYHGKPQTCQFDKSDTPAFASVSEYFTLPSNEYAPLMDHISNVGPIAISVDASKWFMYESGVFDGCNQTQPDINHAVVLEGYGVDSQYGPYWLVRNSWSAKWGENGYIRLRRHPDEQTRCGMDITPDHGVECKDGPSEVKVCGTCGLLYDNAYPVTSRPSRL